MCRKILSDSSTLRCLVRLRALLVRVSRSGRVRFWGHFGLNRTSTGWSFSRGGPNRQPNRYRPVGDGCSACCDRFQPVATQLSSSRLKSVATDNNCRGQFKNQGVHIFITVASNISVRYMRLSIRYQDVLVFLGLALYLACQMGPPPSVLHCWCCTRCRCFACL